jgi:hypothetical protein
MDFKRSLPVVAETDVLVCGCGSAGVAATIVAARRGARTMAVERWGFAGGFMTAVYGPGLDGFVDIRSGLPVVGGVVFEFVETAAVIGGAGLKGDIGSTRFQPSSDLRDFDESPDWTPIHFDIELFKLHADRLMEEAGATVLYHTHVADTVLQGNRIEGVVVVNKGGLGVIKAKTVVDATGDADVAATSGAPFSMNEELQPMSLHFRIRNIRGIEASLRERCSEVLKEAQRRGELPLYGGPWMGKLQDDEMWINSTRIAGSGIDPADVTRAEIQGRRDARTIFRLWKENLEEFRDAIFIESGPVAGVRETRRIQGRATITKSDILAKKEVKDAVVLGAWYVDLHPRGKSGFHMHEVIRPYDIGFGTMVASGVENLVVAGRCHSADSAALASTRVNITAMGMGQAAGCAAAMAAAEATAIPDIDIPRLQSTLLDDGVVILDRAQKVLAVGDALGDDIPESKAR